MTKEFQITNSAKRALDCGGKRSATPLWVRARQKSGVAATALQDGKRRSQSLFELRHSLVIRISSLDISKICSSAS
jgi:hypothetical protein